MTATAYRFHSIEADGPWTSPSFPPAERRHIVQGVIGGHIMKRPRWAEDLDGNFIYGLDAKGKEMKAAPTTSRHHATKKSPAQLQREIDEALARSQAPIAKFNPSQLRVGQYFDHFGHTYEILKIGRDKNRTVQIARSHMDRFGKVDFIDHRSFPARDFDRQHLRPLTDREIGSALADRSPRDHATTKTHTVYDLAQVDKRTGKTTRVLHKHFSTRADAKEAQDEYAAGNTDADVAYRIRSRKVAIPDRTWHRED